MSDLTYEVKHHLGCVPSWMLREILELYWFLGKKKYLNIDEECNRLLIKEFKVRHNHDRVH